MTFAVLCAGQGGQHVDMLSRALLNPAGASVIESANKALETDLRGWMRPGDGLYTNQRAQPLVCIAALATWAALRPMVPAPVAFAGYSVGELAAYGLADALDAADLARLSNIRARLMDAAHNARPGGLIAVRGLTRSEVQKITEHEGAHIAIVVSHDAFVLGGPSHALDGLQARVANLGAQVTSLRIGVAAHTPLLASAAAQFRAVMLESPLRPPVRPVIAGIDGRPVTTRERAIETLASQVDHTIEWGRCLDALLERGCRVFLEVGPGRALSRMARERLEDIEARSVEEFGSFEAAAAWVRQRLT